MEFSGFEKALQKNFAEMAKGATHLFEVAVDKDEMWTCQKRTYPEAQGKNAHMSLSCRFPSVYNFYPSLFSLSEESGTTAWERCLSISVREWN